MSYVKPKEWTDLPLRTCHSLHHCVICDKHITLGQKYFDGGYARRAHEECAMPDSASKKVFSMCNVCGRQLMNIEEFEMGMCLICAAE